MSNTTQNKGVPVAFAAIDPYVQTHEVIPTEVNVSGRPYVLWGKDNLYPEYLYDLYRNVASLSSVVNGSVDYTVGNGVSVSFTPQPRGMNAKGQTPAEFVRQLALSYFISGGFQIEVIRNNAGDVAELNALDFRHLRSSKENEAFYYSEDWAKRSTVSAVVLPKYIPDARNVAASVLYVKNNNFQTYPMPIYGTSIKACEIERLIDDYHLNSLNNGFMGSYVINFNDGVPEQEQQREIERQINEKFGGVQNAARIMVAWNSSKDNAVTLQKLEVDDYGDRYEALVSHCRRRIFTAFRANPNLFGIPTESLGFSQEEYDSAFRLYNRTQIQPVQRLICESVGKIFGNPDYMQIEPFTM